jgi:hypothetical protein
MVRGLIDPMVRGWTGRFVDLLSDDPLTAPSIGQSIVLLIIQGPRRSEVSRILQG